MILPEYEQKLNVVLHTKINGHVYKMYASTDVMACYHCGAYGHVKNSCPILMRSSENQGQEIVDPPSPRHGVGERGESSSPPVREWQTVGPSSRPPLYRTVLMTTWRGFVTVSRKKGQKRSCPVVNETKTTQSKILVVSDVPSLQDASHIEIPSLGLGIEPEPIITLTFICTTRCLPELYECDVDIENTRASQEATSGDFENFGVCSDKKEFVTEVCAKVCVL